MKFANTIQVLARRSCDIAAFVYDRNFRMWREIYYVNLPWDLVHSELHGDAIALGLKIKLEAMKTHPGNQGLHKSPFLGSKTLGKVPTNGPRKWSFCYSLIKNDGECERGSSCTYPHICEKCWGQHSKKACSNTDRHKNTPQRRFGANQSTKQVTFPNPHLKINVMSVSTPIKVERLRIYL